MIEYEYGLEYDQEYVLQFYENQDPGKKLQNIFLQAWCKGKACYI